MWKCSQCAKVFKFNSERIRHEQSHVPQFECKVCSKQFTFISALRRHEKQHERTGNVMCELCKRKFKDSVLLKRHIQYAHGGTHKCSKCNSTFHSDSALHTHKKIHKPESERKFHCSYGGCTKTFNFAHHLKHHELTHTNQKQHFCKICGKGFIQLHHLKMHRKSHEPDAWIACLDPDCDKMFSNEYARKRHYNNSHATRRTLKWHNKRNATKPTNVVKDCDPETTGTFPADQNSKNTLEGFSETQPTKETMLYSTNVIDDKIEEDKTIINSIITCKSILGCCIVTGSTEMSDNCLCAQMTTNDEDYNDIIAPIEKKDLNSKVNLNYINAFEENNPICIKNEKVEVTCSTPDKNMCERCECANTCPINPVNRISSNDNKEVPQIEYRNDGTIKIKETFDLDIDVDTDFYSSQNERSREDSANYESKDLTSSSSCKDAIGNCIVSDNDDGACLCAKMNL